MTAKVIKLQEMQNTVKEALRSLSGARHADVCDELRSLQTRLQQDTELRGCCISASEEEIQPLLIPYVKMLTWERPMAALVAVSGSTCVYMDQLFHLLRRSTAACVILPKPLPALKEAVLVAMMPLTRRAGDVFELDYAIRKIFH